MTTNSSDCDRTSGPSVSSPTAHQPARLSESPALTGSTPLAPRHSRLTSSRPPPERLPTYDELKAQEGHRFGRWRGWVEKRARERTRERVEERRQAEIEGKPLGTGWDLPNPPDQSHQPINQPSSSSHLDRNPSLISARDEHAAFVSASQNHRQTFGNLTQHDRRTAAQSLPLLRPNLEPGPGLVNLTPSSSIHSIGSRFLPQFPSQPLCAVPLPISNNSKYTAGPQVERFLLVGTIEGLYVCDLIPSLSHTIKTDSVSSTDSKIYQIWQGLGIHQLEIAVEGSSSFRPLTGSAGTSNLMTGIVIALTSQTNELHSHPTSDTGLKSIKMWPLQSLINLVKFRAFSENSECLDLRQRASSSKRVSAISASASALAGLKLMFDKGKQKAASLNTDDLFEFVSGTSSSKSERACSPLQGPASSSSENTASGFSAAPSSGQSHLQLPLQWAQQTIALDLPRIQASGPILFIKLCDSPSRGFNPISDELDRLSSDPIPAGLRPRSQTICRDRDDSTGSNDGWWYLIIATKQLVFVMESQPSAHRTWHQKLWVNATLSYTLSSSTGQSQRMCAEMSAPFTPKTADLVLSDFSGKPPRPIIHNSTSSAHSRSLTINRRSNSPWDALGQKSVLLTMKEYSAVISLQDLSVRELDIPGTVTSTQSSAEYSQPSLAKKLGGNSFNGLSHLETVQATLMHLPRTNSFTSSVEPILTSRKVRDRGFNRGSDDGFQVENRRPSRNLNDRRWIGCEQLIMPVPPLHSTHPPDQEKGLEPSKKAKPVMRAIYLVTRGHLTYAVLSPFGLDLKARYIHKGNASVTRLDSHAGGGTGSVPPPILLKPFHTFSWRGYPVKIQAHIIPTPAHWARRNQIPNEVEDKQDQDSDKDNDLFCCLTAFTPSGIEVQEGFICVDIVRGLWDRQQRAKNRAGLSRSFFTPASERWTYENLDKHQRTEILSSDQTPAPPMTSTPKRQNSLPADGEEASDSSSYDYSARIGFLCNSGAWFMTGRPQLNRNISDMSNDDRGDNESNSALDGRAKGSFFWKEAVGEWKIMYICNSRGLEN